MIYAVLEMYFSGFPEFYFGDYFACISFFSTSGLISSSCSFTMNLLKDLY